MEKQLEKCLTYKILRQHKVLSYSLDGYCSVLNLAIEIDGASHNGGKIGDYDKMRQKEIEEKLGCEFLRIQIPKECY